jgi:hypothetical protein
MNGNVRAVAWVKEDPPGAEFAEVRLTPGRLAARGVAIGSEPVPYRLDYTLQTGPGFVTARLYATAVGEGWRRSLDLRRTRLGTWSMVTGQEGDVPLGPTGGAVTLLGAALDCDLGLSPLTNSPPVLRHGLLDGGGRVEITVAWVSVPDLGVHPDGQRYTFVGADHERRIVRFEALDGTFAADITFDADGLVLDYPGIARRIG